MNVHELKSVKIKVKKKGNRNPKHLTNDTHLQTGMLVSSHAPTHQEAPNQGCLVSLRMFTTTHENYFASLMEQLRKMPWVTTTTRS